MAVNDVPVKKLDVKLSGLISALRKADGNVLMCVQKALMSILLAFLTALYAMCAAGIATARTVVE